MVLSALYIKGFKTFARPVRMPLEGGVTAIVGPNGSGKSNVTDAVLFALGEQSPGVLRAGAMGELIFSGSESLPPAAVAEVTLVFDNEPGNIALPYEEVSVTRRISRDGETEYRINGARSRLSDVRAVAGEAGLGRHSILRQGSVDAIVSGGAAACRLALEEAAGLGVYRRRRLSASRRLEKADAQLEQSRRLEAELVDQLRRIEREAVAAREYREIESQYRKVSLACLYRTATRGLDERRARLKEMEARIVGLSEREALLKAEEADLEPRLKELDERLAALDRTREAMEDLAEDLRTESLRADRNVMRLESASGNGHDPMRAIQHLEEDLARVNTALDDLEEHWESAQRSRDEARQTAARDRRRASDLKQIFAKSEQRRIKFTAATEALQARLRRLSENPTISTLPTPDVKRLGELSGALAEAPPLSAVEDVAALRRGMSKLATVRMDRVSGVSRRRGALEAAVGRAESRVRALDVRDGGASGTRLYEVIRPREGYGAAVEAALGDLGSGLLAADLDEGMQWIQTGEPVVVRLDAHDLKNEDPPPGIPLIDCVEILEERYREPITHLLSGFYVTKTPNEKLPLNGLVAVTPDGLRLTRTTVSRRPKNGSFAREAQLEKARRLLHDLEGEPRFLLATVESEAADASRAISAAEQDISTAAALAVRTARVRETLRREAARHLNAARAARDRWQKREAESRSLEAEISASDQSLSEAIEADDAAKIAFEEAVAIAESAEADLREQDHLRARLRPGVEAGRSRRDRLVRDLTILKESHATTRPSPNAVALRATKISAVLTAAMRERRSQLRRSREEISEAQRGYTGRRSDLGRRAVELAGELATARAERRRDAEDLERAEWASHEAAAEISAEWAADIDAARREAEQNPTATEKERRSLARKLHAFGDVNLLSLSQESELRERHDFVADQRADAEAAATELSRIIQAVDEEIETSFTRTFGRVKEAFGEMVPRMLRGATGSLELSDEGVEIGLKLGRRGWRTLKVLSGGERALLALSFLFSVFLSQSSAARGAFCVLDEAEAALDDLNLARFLDVVDSYRSNGQFLLVTHQKRTMAAADVLYGVTQDATGATIVVSKRTVKD